jgi:imidazolonepropionase-like amidohydrolase
MRATAWPALGPLVLALALPLLGQEPPPEPVVALRVGTVHPVSSPPITEGVIVLRGARIEAVGAGAQVEIPPDAQVFDHPGAHAYPGLIDALSTAFADRRVLDDSSADAATAIVDGLDPFDAVGRSIIAAGITTAFVGTKAATRWRGQGALLRPTAQGFGLLQAPRGAASRLWLDGEDQHPLTRQKEVRALGSAFEGLELYEQQKKRAGEAVAAYERKFAAWLEWHRANKGADGAGERGATPAAGEAAPAEGERRPGGRRPRRGAGEGESGANSEGPPAGQGDGARGAEASAPQPARDGAPERPTYPRPFRDDPAKEALLAMRAGTRILRVEAAHRDSIEAVLRLASEERIARLVLENPREAAPIAARLRDAGVAVVLADLVSDAPDENPDAEALPAALARAGVALCIASGDARSSRQLPLLAALACSRGLDPALAERAITLEAARILGIDDQVGSLEPGKLGDVVITSGPLLATGTRILRVVAGGTTHYEAKP